LPVARSIMAVRLSVAFGYPCWANISIPLCCGPGGRRHLDSCQPVALNNRSLAQGALANQLGRRDTATGEGSIRDIRQIGLQPTECPAGPVSQDGPAPSFSQTVRCLPPSCFPNRPLPPASALRSFATSGDGGRRLTSLGV
jgi:hypothetical protein